MSVTRPLPPVPNLEFERKAARQFLREVRAADPAATARLRATHPEARRLEPSAAALSDVHLVLAREYGFASWARLVKYFHIAERQRHRVNTALGSPSGYEYYATRILEQHAQRKVRAGRMLAEYVPRFFGLPLEHVFGATVTLDEARHALARTNGFPSWDALLHQATEAQTEYGDGWDRDTTAVLFRALERADLTTLRLLVHDEPALLRPSPRELARGGGLPNFALGAEKRVGVTVMRPVMRWLESQGFDMRTLRNTQLCGRPFFPPEDVQSMLDRGADPAWIAPNGLSVLEHALLRYHNGACVELIAARVTPPRALWVAAGLGDVETVASFLDARGLPTAEARAHRPDFIAVGPYPWPSDSDATDEQVLFEAAYVAAANRRVTVLDYLVSRGFPVNSLAWNYPLLAICVSFGWVESVECLVRHGADPDLRAPGEQMSSARELAGTVGFLPWNLPSHRLLALVGVDVPARLAERERRPVPHLASSPDLQRILTLAADDAVRAGDGVVSMEHLFFGLLRHPRTRETIAKMSGMDFNRLRDDVLPRVRVGEPDKDVVSPPHSTEVTHAVHEALAFAASRHDEQANGVHLLAVLAQPGNVVATWVERYGGTLVRLREVLDNWLEYDNAE